MRANLMQFKVNKQTGFSLIEVMIGLVVGLIATLVIANVFTVYERQKRATTGTSDAQTNGAIAMYNVQRDMQNAGYGLPVFSTLFTPFNCPTTGAADVVPTIDHDNNAATPNIGITPVVITDGGAGSDTVAVRYGTSMRGGTPVQMLPGTGTGGAGGADFAVVDINLGCSVNNAGATDNDIALVVQPGTPTTAKCTMSRIASVSAAGAAQKLVQLGSATNVAAGNHLACLGAWNEVQYSVQNNQLMRTGAMVAGVPNATAVPVMSDIVSIQAQYGISNAFVPGDNKANNQITQWVNATAGWANPSALDRNRIKAVRIAIVARNGLLETEDVTAACSSLTAANPTGLCAWDGSTTAASPAPAIDLTADANWRRYRYRVYESIIPLKNVIWTRDKL